MPIVHAPYAQSAAYPYSIRTRSSRRYRAAVLTSQAPTARGLRPLKRRRRSARTTQAARAPALETVKKSRPDPRRGGKDTQRSKQPCLRHPRPPRPARLDPSPVDGHFQWELPLLPFRHSPCTTEAASTTGQALCFSHLHLHLHPQEQNQSRRPPAPPSAATNMAPAA